MDNRTRKGSAELSGFSPLHYACASRKLDTVFKCLEEGAPVNAADIYGETALHLAAQSGNVEILRALIEHKAIIDVRNASQSTPLHIACQHGHRAAIKFLVEHGANSSLRNKKGQNVFELCKNDDCRQVVMEATESVSVPTVAGENDLTPLMQACVRGDLILVFRLLADAPESVNAKSASGDTALHLACQTGSVEVARILLDHKADVSITNARGKTAFEEAALIGRSELVSELSSAPEVKTDTCQCSEAAKEYDSGSKMSFTPLHYAAANNNLSVVRELSKSGTDVNPKNIYGDTPLHYAARSAGVEIVRLLIAAKAEVNAPSDAGDSPVMLAVRRGNREIVSMLVAAGGDLDLRNNRGVCPRTIMEQHGIVLATSVGANEGPGGDRGEGGHGSGSAGAFSPLMYASVKGELEIVKSLVAGGKGSVTDVNAYGDSALCYACLGKSAELVNFLISAKSDVNLVNSFGETPLHMAATNSGKVGPEIVKILLKNGAEKGRRNKKGKTPLEVAKQEGVRVVLS